MKITFIFCILFLSVNAKSQSWSYDFSNINDTATNLNSFADNTSFFSNTPVNGGTYNVKIGGTGGSIILTQKTDTSSVLKLTSAANSFTNKFTVYGWSPAEATAYFKCNLKTASTQDGTIVIELGNAGINSVYNNFYSYLNGISTAETVLLINYENGKIISVQENNKGKLKTISDSVISSNKYQTFEFFINNSNENITYTKDGTNNLNTQKWDLWVDGQKLSPTNGFDKAAAFSGVSLHANEPINAFGFFAENSNDNAASISIQNIFYAVSLPSTMSSNFYTFNKVDKINLVK